MNKTFNKSIVRIGKVSKNLNILNRLRSKPVLNTVNPLFLYQDILEENKLTLKADFCLFEFLFVLVGI